MGLFVCNRCNCVDIVEIARPDTKTWLCSQCQPGNEWHDFFEQKQYNPEEDIVVNRPNEHGVSL